MIARGDNYTNPRPVLIDFGLSAPFSDVVAGVSGTPGYIPPETWETGLWDPRGDIFSLGITFFQLMTGQVPNSTGSVMGVLQPCADSRALKHAAFQLAMPWERFPQSMPFLQQLVKQMVHRSCTERPRAQKALRHEWFASISDGSLPESTLMGLANSADAEEAKELVMWQLMNQSNLDELRDLYQACRVGSSRSLHDSPTSCSPAEHAKKMVSLLRRRGVAKQIAMDLMQSTAVGARTKLEKMLKEAVRTKEIYSHQFVKDLFHELDTDLSGKLSASELEELLDSDAFECQYDDIQSLVKGMGPDAKGEIPFEAFKRCILEDGRIARRTEAERTRNCNIM